MIKTFVPAAVLSLLLQANAAPVQLKIPPHDEDDPVVVIRGVPIYTVNPTSSQAKLGTLASSVADDPLQVASMGQAKGLLTYTFNVYKNANSSHYLVIQDTRSNTKVVYPIENIGTNFVSEPKFSPDGSCILFKVGEDATNPHYRLYVLDIRAQKLKKLASVELEYFKVVWSPDSRSIAFVENCGPFGEDLNQATQLTACEWKTGKRHVVVQNAGVVGGFCWASADTLLYTGQPKTKPTTASDEVAIPQPNIYEAKTNRTHHLLIRNGRWPSISPDGKHIAFFGAKNPAHPPALSTEWWGHSQGSWLCIANRNGTGRHALVAQNNFYAPLLWPSSPNHLISLDQVRPSPQVQFAANDWNLQTRKPVSVGLLNSQDYEAISRAGVNPPISVRGSMSKDGSFFFHTYQITGLIQDQHQYEYAYFETIQRFDARKSSSTLVAQIIKGNGADWFSFE